jgi:hypothetical protein
MMSDTSSDEFPRLDGVAASIVEGPVPVVGESEVEVIETQDFQEALGSYPAHERSEQEGLSAYSYSESLPHQQASTYYSPSYEEESDVDEFDELVEGDSNPVHDYVMDLGSVVCSYTIRWVKICLWWCALLFKVAWKVTRVLTVSVFSLVVRQLFKLSWAVLSGLDELGKMWDRKAPALNGMTNRIAKMRRKTIRRTPTQVVRTSTIPLSWKNLLRRNYRNVCSYRESTPTQQGPWGERIREIVEPYKKYLQKEKELVRRRAALAARAKLTEDNDTLIEIREELAEIQLAFVHGVAATARKVELHAANPRYVKPQFVRVRAYINESPTRGYKVDLLAVRQWFEMACQSIVAEEGQQTRQELADRMALGGSIAVPHRYYPMLLESTSWAAYVFSRFIKPRQ